MQIADALELARYEGREAVFQDGEDPAPAFSADGIRQSFREQIEFLQQKRPLPTQDWTDAMYGDHDRAFVVAGATNLAMLEDFQAAVIRAAESYDYDAFARDFDRIVAQYGWDYNGGREWRIRTIFGTNIRTSYMAGRLKQMRDPDVVRMRPYWMYVHGETRVPKHPRPEHLAHDGLVLMHDDPWWEVWFPPNGWLCSCGVRTLSKGDLKRMGKSGPDKAPDIPRSPYTHEASGVTVDQPDGIDYGWDYQPGDHWQRKILPQALEGEADRTIPPLPRHLVQVSAPGPLEALLKGARDFETPLLADGHPPEYYAARFMGHFGLSLGQSKIITDVAGHRLLIDDGLFRNWNGTWKILKRGRQRYAERMAETLLSPDEIWIGLREVLDPETGKINYQVDRRYIRVDRSSGLMLAFQIGRRWWETVTSYAPDRGGRANVRSLHARRGGKLVWERNGGQG